MYLKITTKIACIILFFNVFACSTNDNPIEKVDPFIGTDYHGHTYPGATVPFGMVQLSPDTRQEGWDACSGYHYSDNSIAGFSHTHLSGTGIGDYGDVMMMPTVDNDQLVKGDVEDPDSGFRSRFSKSNEKASPGYYSVLLDDYNILVELSATRRTGIQRYTFPESDNARIVLDLAHNARNHNNDSLFLQVVDNKTIQGLKKTRGWAQQHYVYFYAEFSKPFDSYLINDKEVNQASGKDVKGYFKYKTANNEQILVKVGISAVSIEGAKLNLETENSKWDFDAVVKSAKDEWTSQLDKISVKGGTPEQQRTFYTAMYHAFLAPNTYIDVDGKYRDMDLNIYQTDKFTNYTVHSIWDTYRTLNPLFTILQQDKTNDFINSYLSAYENGGILPKWALAGNYTGTMIGYHAVSVIADAYLKGIRDYDVEKAFEAMVHSSNYNPDGIAAANDNILDKLMSKGKLYNVEMGFIPADLVNESVSRALEYAYDDWCIAQMAKALGKTKEYEIYSERAKRYQVYFDKSTGFMRGKTQNGEWVKDFNPKFSKHRKDEYTEGNAWQWTWYVPHDVEGMVKLHGSKEKFITKLDSLFSIDSTIEGEEASVDITGLIGQYAHGNEPSHHIAYLYNFVGESWKTQEIVDSILTTLYSDKPDGLSGNEDCGQMSAWYIMSSMGIYPVSPGDSKYYFGRPLFDSATLNLENGNSFTINAINNSAENKYVQSVSLNGKDLNVPFIMHDEIMKGGELKFVMGDKPNKELF